MNTRSLLVVFAHPDDEGFSMAGTLAKYSREGVKTTLLFATRGEAGRVHNGSVDGQANLALIRENEQREACRILGIDEPVFLDYPDGRLIEVDRTEAIGCIVGHIRRLRPEVLVTFDAMGVYGHPDHIAVHELTVAAAACAARRDRYPEQLEAGLEPHSLGRLFASVIPKTVIQRLHAVKKAGGGPTIPGGDGKYLSPELLGTREEDITTRIVLDDWQFRRKLDAIRAHRSQLSPEASVFTTPVEILRRRLGVESFQILDSTLPVRSDDDLFAG